MDKAKLPKAQLTVDEVGSYGQAYEDPYPSLQQSSIPTAVIS